MVSKDNFKIKSNVAVITREKKDRIENCIRDAAVVGAAFLLIGGYGARGFDFKEEEEKEKSKEE